MLCNNNSASSSFLQKILLGHAYMFGMFGGATDSASTSAAMLSMQQRGQEVAHMVEDARGEQREYVPKVSTMFP